MFIAVCCAHPVLRLSCSRLFALLFCFPVLKVDCSGAGADGYAPTSNSNHPHFPAPVGPVHCLPVTSVVCCCTTSSLASAPASSPPLLRPHAMLACTLTHTRRQGCLLLQHNLQQGNITMDRKRMSWNWRAELARLQIWWLSCRLAGAGRAVHAPRRRRPIHTTPSKHLQTLRCASRCS